MKLLTRRKLSRRGGRLGPAAAVRARRDRAPRGRHSERSAVLCCAWIVYSARHPPPSPTRAVHHGRRPHCHDSRIRDTFCVSSKGGSGGRGNTGASDEKCNEASRVLLQQGYCCCSTRNSFLLLPPLTNPPPSPAPHQQPKQQGAAEPLSCMRHRHAAAAAAVGAGAAAPLAWPPPAPGRPSRTKALPSSSSAAVATRPLRGWRRPL